MRIFYLSVSLLTVICAGMLLTTNTFAYFNGKFSRAINKHKFPNISPTPTFTPSPKPSPATQPMTPTVALTPTPNALVTPTPSQNKQSRVNPVCISSHLDRLSTTDIDKQLTLMQQAGANWIRFDFVWGAMEHQKGSWDFSKYDYIINAAQAKGINVIALLVQYGQPDYIRQGRDYMTPPSTSDYQYFVTNASAHFKGKIELYEIGNEPNMAMFWPPAPDANAYSALLKAGYTAIKQNDPQAKVISAGLAPVDDWQGFINKMYTTGNIKGYFDYMGFHPYSWPQSPDITTGTPFSNVATVMSIEQSHGDNKPIMGTEFGWPTFSGGVSESQQADYINRVYQKVMFENYSYVPIACVYDFINDGTDNTNAEDNFGIVRADYSLKQSYSRLQQVRQTFDSNFSTINP